MYDFSIIIATHRRPELLRRAIASCTAQEKVRVQLIVVSDVFDLETYKDCCTLMDRNHIFVQKFGGTGPSESRNLGIENAKGEYVIFLDDDDEFEINFLPSIRARLAEIAVDTVCYTNFKIVNASNPHEPNSFSLEGFNCMNLWVKNFIPNNCVIYPRRCLEAVRFDSEIAYEDWDFLLAVAERHELKHIPIFGPIIHKNDGAENAARGRQNENGKRLLECYAKIYNRYPPPASEIGEARLNLLASAGVAMEEAKRLLRLT